MGIDVLTLMLWIGDELAHHGLYDTYITIERTAEKATEKCKPKVGREAHQQQRCDSTEAACNQYRLSPYSVR